MPTARLNCTSAAPHKGCCAPALEGKLFDMGMTLIAVSGITRSSAHVAVHVSFCMRGILRWASQGVRPQMRARGGCLLR